MASMRPPPVCDVVAGVPRFACKAVARSRVLSTPVAREVRELPAVTTPSGRHDREPSCSPDTTPVDPCVDAVISAPARVWDRSWLRCRCWACRLPLCGHLILRCIRQDRRVDRRAPGRVRLVDQLLDFPRVVGREHIDGRLNLRLLRFELAYRRWLCQRCLSVTQCLSSLSWRIDVCLRNRWPCQQRHEQRQELLTHVRPFVVEMRSNFGAMPYRTASRLTCPLRALLSSAEALEGALRAFPPSEYLREPQRGLYELVAVPNLIVPSRNQPDLTPPLRSLPILDISCPD